MRIAALSLASVLLASCAAGPARPRGAREPTIEVDGVARSYRLHVPATWDGVRPLPLLLVFHGAGSDADDVARGSGFDALADAGPTLVAYPEAVGGRFDLPADRGSRDVRFVDALVARLRGRFPVDGDRVYASGFSNGAAFCYRLAAERPTLLAAIAPVAGYLPPLGPAPSGAAVAVPLLPVHGTADDRVPAPSLGGGPDDAVATWARRNGASRGPTTGPAADLAGLDAFRASYAGPSSRADATLLLVAGAGHAWPGGPAGPVSRAIVAFFGAHPRGASAPPGR